MKNILYLASQSASRQQLLREAQIPFELLSQTADEAACDWGLPLHQLVASIARYKMEHADLSGIDHEKEIFVLTADTLSQDENGAIQGKPKDRADAIEKIKEARGGTRLCTGFCLDKKAWRNGGWQTIERIEEVVHAQYQFIIPDVWIETYLDTSPVLSCSNAIAVEQYGGQFLKEVQGSYTAIVGLPVYEVRQALEKLGFFSR
jgi:septum formation protein